MPMLKPSSVKRETKDSRETLQSSGLPTSMYTSQVYFITEFLHNTSYMCLSIVCVEL